MQKKPIHNPNDSIPVDLVFRLRQARSVTILTGAGISAESGIPTFRQAQTGLWERFSPEELASPQAFQRNPELIWQWYAWRKKLCETSQPNPGHFALVEFEQRLENFTLITQNVDGLHQRAGNRIVIELHGNIFRTRCKVEGIVFKDWPDFQETPPLCPNCGALLRPDVVWFGESLSTQILQEAWDAAVSSDLFFSIGTSGIVYPAASLPLAAIGKGIPVVEVNPEETALSSQASFTFHCKAGVFLPQLVREVWKVIVT